MMTQIANIVAREIFDSRGLPTIEVDLILSCGVRGRAAVPSGASTGSKEALELRDADPQRFHGKGVLCAISHIRETITKALVGMDATQQMLIDQTMIELDGTENKTYLGANAILAVSLACARAAAKAQQLPLFRYLGGVGPFSLPVPMMNIINGGVHANNNLDIQEFMIVPVGIESFHEAMRCGAEIFQTLKNLCVRHGLSTSVGDEGGFAPNLQNNEAAIQLILDAIQQSGYEPGRDVMLALDCAASEFYQDGVYNLASEALTLSAIGLTDYLETLCQRYPIISIEDGMGEDDWEGWQILTQRLGKNIQLVGDDLFVTNPRILEEGIRNGLANSLLVKVNQIGTLTETLQAIDIAKCSGYTAVISHRSGETEDSFIADLAVAKHVMQIKTGSLSRSDRMAKYNQLLRLEEILGPRATYPGVRAFGSINRNQ